MKPLPPEREPLPVSVVPKIDGGHLDFSHERPKKRPPTIVQGEFTPANTARPSARQYAVLSGGPADGREVQVGPGQESYSIPVPRTGPAPEPTWTERTVAGKTLRQMVMPGDLVEAIYRRSKRRTEEGMAIYEFASAV